MSKYVCSICGYVYDDSKEKVPFNELPDDYICPLCGASKSSFVAAKEDSKVKVTDVAPIKNKIEVSGAEENLRRLSYEELSLLFSSLAKGSEKQYLTEESQLYMKLSDYYKAKISLPQQGNDKKSNISSISEHIDNDLNSLFPYADKIAEQANDRGAKRVLTWSKKVSMILKSILERYEKQGDSMLENTNIYVCEICGFIFIGDKPPEICPVCKVPSLKIHKISTEVK